MVRQIRQEMDQLVFEAGFGRGQLSRLGFLAAKYYHWIVGGLAIAIVVLSMAPFLAPWALWLWATVYLLYFVVRQLMSERGKRLFYRPHVQFLRAQAGVIAIAVLVYYLEAHGHKTLLWLTFLLALQIASKHCQTSVFLLTVLEVCILLWAIQFSTLPPDMRAAPAAYWNVFVRILWIGLLAFLIHYLVRNIDARNDTIKGYQLANALSARLECLETPGDRWKTIVDTTLSVVQASSTSLWRCDSHRNQITVLAVSANVTAKSDDMPANQDDPHAGISMSGDHVLAHATRVGALCTFYVKDGVVASQGGYAFPNPNGGEFGGSSTLLVVPITAGATGKGAGSAAETIALLCIRYDEDAVPQATVLAEYQALLADMVYHIKPFFVYEKHLEELRTLHQIGQEVSREYHLDHVLDSLVAATVNALGFGFASISLVDADAQLIRCVRAMNMPQGSEEQANYPISGNDVQAHIVRTAETLVIDGKDPRLQGRGWERASQNAMVRVFAPIVTVDQETHKERVIGTLEAGHTKGNGNAIGAQQIAMLQPFLGQAALALEKAQLFGQMEKKAQTLTTLHRVGQILGSARELPTVLDKIGRSAEQILAADIVMLYRYDAEAHSLHPPSVYGNIWGKKPLNLNLREGSVLAKIIREKRPYYAPNAPIDPFLNPGETTGQDKLGQHGKYRSFTGRQNIKSFAGVPLLAGGSVVGVMCVNYRKRHQFALDEQQVLELFGQQAALAIRNAEANELARQLVVEEERGRLARDLHDTISQYLPAIKFMAATAEAQIDSRPDLARKELTKINEAVRDVLKAVQLNVLQRRPAALENGLSQCIVTDARFLRATFGIDVLTEIELDVPLPALVEEALHMVVKEALVNAARHAQARRVSVRVKTRWDCIGFRVCDDGCGFDLNRINPGDGHGLSHIRDRMRIIGGRVHVRSALGVGTIIYGSVPAGRHIHDDSAPYS